MPNSLEYRLSQTERDVAVMRVEMTNLTKATEKNTSAMDKLTESLQGLVTTLSYNKGVISSAFKSASIGTVVMGGIFGLVTWLYGVFHGGPK